MRSNRAEDKTMAVRRDEFVAGKHERPGLSRPQLGFREAVRTVLRQTGGQGPKWEGVQGILAREASAGISKGATQRAAQVGAAISAGMALLPVSGAAGTAIAVAAGATGAIQAMEPFKQASGAGDPVAAVMAISHGLPLPPVAQFALDGVAASASAAMGGGSMRSSMRAEVEAHVPGAAQIGAGAAVANVQTLSPQTLDMLLWGQSDRAAMQATVAGAGDGVARAALSVVDMARNFVRDMGKARTGMLREAYAEIRDSSSPVDRPRPSAMEQGARRGEAILRTRQLPLPRGELPVGIPPVSGNAGAAPGREDVQMFDVTSPAEPAPAVGSRGASSEPLRSGVSRADLTPGPGPSRLSAPIGTGSSLHGLASRAPAMAPAPAPALAPSAELLAASKALRSARPSKPAGPPMGAA